jgi:hypothetical protein
MKLKAATRNALPTSKFAGPGRSYPVPDKSHAANAKARATQMVSKGKLSPAMATRIRKKANAVLGSSGSSAAD